MEILLAICLNEIRERAIAFAKEWKDESNEDAEAKSFWDDFFNIFGVPRRRVATFEQKVHVGGGGVVMVTSIFYGRELSLSNISLEERV